jgi:two-component system, OmpR family, sensor histidine kinase BaeS
MAVEIRLTNTSAVPLSGSDGKLFQRFHRAGTTPLEEHGAAGLGLAIVKEIVESHGGAVGSQLANDEVTMWFTWPL